PAEEGLQVGLVAVEEAAHLEGEEAGEHQEDEDEDEGQGRGEIALELALENDLDGIHAATPSLGVCSRVLGWVRVRNTSSSRPDSRCSSGTSQSFLAIRAETAASGLAPGLGMAVIFSSRSFDSMPETSLRAAISRRAACMCSVRSKRRLTA